MNHDLPAAEQEEVDTIIDLDRAEILSILRDIQEISARPETPADPFAGRRLR